MEPSPNRNNQQPDPNRANTNNSPTSRTNPSPNRRPPRDNEHAPPTQGLLFQRDLSPPSYTIPAPPNNQDISRLMADRRRLQERARELEEMDLEPFDFGSIEEDFDENRLLQVRDSPRMEWRSPNFIGNDPPEQDLMRPNLYLNNNTRRLFTERRISLDNRELINFQDQAPRNNQRGNNSRLEPIRPFRVINRVRLPNQPEEDLSALQGQTQNTGRRRAANDLRNVPVFENAEGREEPARTPNQRNEASDNSNETRVLELGNFEEEEERRRRNFNRFLRNRQRRNIGIIHTFRDRRARVPVQRVRRTRERETNWDIERPTLPNRVIQLPVRTRQLINVFGGIDGTHDPLDDRLFPNFHQSIFRNSSILGVKRNQFRQSEESELTIKKVLEKNKEFFESANVKKIREKKSSKNPEEHKHEAKGVCAKRINGEVQDSSCICIECFLAGDHRNHKFKIKVNGNGVCDCGDPDGWRPEGNCSKHKGQVNSQDVVSREVFDDFSKQLITQLFDLIFESYISTDSEVLLKTKETKEKLFLFLKGLVYSCKDNNDFKILISNSLISRLSECSFLEQGKVEKTRKYFEDIHVLKPIDLKKNINELKISKHAFFVKAKNKPKASKASKKQNRMEKFKKLFTFNKGRKSKKNESLEIEEAPKFSKLEQALKNQMTSLVKVYEKPVVLTSISMLDLIICVVKKNDKPFLMDSVCSFASILQNSSNFSQFSKVITRLFLDCFVNIDFKLSLADSLVKAKQFKNVGFTDFEKQLCGSHSVMKGVLGRPSLCFQALHALTRNFGFRSNGQTNLDALKNSFKDFFYVLNTIAGSVKYHRDTLKLFVYSNEIFNFVSYSVYFESLFNMDFDVMNANSLFTDNYTKYCLLWDKVTFRICSFLNREPSEQRRKLMVTLARHLLQGVYFVEKIRDGQVKSIKKARRIKSDPYLNLRFNNLLRFFTLILFNLVCVNVTKDNELRFKSKEELQKNQEIWKKIKENFELKELQFFYKKVSANCIFYIKRLAKFHKKYDDLLSIESQSDYGKFQLLFVKMMSSLDLLFKEIFEDVLQKQMKAVLYTDDSNEAILRFYEKQFQSLHEIFYSPAVYQFFLLPVSLDFHKNELLELSQKNVKDILIQVPMIKNMIIFFAKVRKAFKFPEIKKILRIPFQIILERTSDFFLERVLDNLCTFDVKNSRFVLIQSLFESKKKRICNSFEWSYGQDALTEALVARNKSLMHNKTVYFPENLFYLKENSLLKVKDFIKEFAPKVDLGEVWVNVDPDTTEGLQEKSHFHLKLFIDLFHSILDRGKEKSGDSPPKRKMRKMKKFLKKTISKPSKERIISPKKAEERKISKDQITPELSRLAKYILILGNIARSHSLQISSLFYFAKNLKPHLPESLWKLCDVILKDRTEMSMQAPSEKIKVETPKSKSSNRFAKLMRKIKKKKKKNFKETERIVEEKTGIKIPKESEHACKRKDSTTTDLCISCQNTFEKDEDVFFLVRLHKYDAHRLLLFQNHWDMRSNLVSKKKAHGFLTQVWSGCKVSVPATCNHPYHLKCIQKTLQNKKPVCLLCKMKSHVYINRKLLKPDEIKQSEHIVPGKAEQENSSVNSEGSEHQILSSNARFDELTNRFMGTELEGSRLFEMMQQLSSIRPKKPPRHPNPKIHVFEQIVQGLLKVKGISSRKEVDLVNKAFGVKLYQKLMMPVEMVGKMISVWCPENFVRKISPCLSQYFYLLFSLKNLSEGAFLEFSMVCNEIGEILGNYLEKLRNSKLVFYSEMIAKEVGLSSMEVLYVKSFLANFWSSVSGLKDIKCIKNQILPIFEEVNLKILPRILLVKIYQRGVEAVELSKVNNETILSRCIDILKTAMILRKLIFQEELQMGGLDSPDLLDDFLVRSNVLTEIRKLGPYNSRLKKYFRKIRRKQQKKGTYKMDSTKLKVMDFSKLPSIQPSFVQLDNSFYKEYANSIYQNKDILEKVEIKDGTIFYRCLFCGEVLNQPKKGKRGGSSFKRHFEEFHGNLNMLLGVGSSISLKFDGKGRSNSTDIYFSKYGDKIKDNRNLTSDFYLNQKVIFKLKDDIINYNI